ncbi:NAD-dependent protein deacetylase [Phytohalomonas tamaricis]|uniref:NAD-dependent protein deacetylase n=1 Tax=Phytohalomonas tamaricis TaxID=2081032 RepID=UPI0021D42531|nr:NAD-dependent protein deacetylase [Phytohalomonas tamaricis]
MAQHNMAADQAILDMLIDFVRCHSPLCVLTGAGVSTDCGIPDYRDEAGQWKRPPPMSQQDYLASALARQRYWARSLVGFRLLDNAVPGRAHHALTELEQRGVINGIITQNVDRLHQKSGSQHVIDLHGRADQVRCLQCDLLIERRDFHETLAALNPEWVGMKAEIAPDGDAYLDGVDFSTFQLPDCPRCGYDILKTDVVFFGDSVPKPRLAQAMAMLNAAPALLVVGSSLMVFSGFRFARHASQTGKPVACLNLGHTRADELFEIKLEQPISEGLEALLDGLDA